ALRILHHAPGGRRPAKALQGGGAEFLQPLDLGVARSGRPQVEVEAILHRFRLGNPLEQLAVARIRRVDDLDVILPVFSLQAPPQCRGPEASNRRRLRAVDRERLDPKGHGQAVSGVSGPASPCGRIGPKASGPCPSTRAQASSKMRSPALACSSLITSGGAMRTAESPARRTRSPCLKHAISTASATSGDSNSTPIMRPSPRTSRTIEWCPAIPRSASIMDPPTLAALSTRPPRSRSRVARAAA